MRAPLFIGSQEYYRWGPEMVNFDHRPTAPGKLAYRSTARSTEPKGTQPCRSTARSTGTTRELGSYSQSTDRPYSEGFVHVLVHTGWPTSRLSSGSIDRPVDRQQAQARVYRI